MSEQQLKRLYRDMHKAREQIDLLQEKRELEMELRDLSPDERVGQSFFFHRGIDNQIERCEREFMLLNRQADVIEKRLNQEKQPERTWRNYAEYAQDKSLETKDRMVDLGERVRDKMRDTLPQRGNPERTEIERLKAEMDRAFKQSFPELHKQKQQDLKAKEREREVSERPLREAEKEITRNERKEARQAARDEATEQRAEAEVDNKPETRRSLLEQRLADLNERLQRHEEPQQQQ